MPEGTIKSLVADRGFGFINTGGRKDLFFHFTTLQGVGMEDLREGQRVEFGVAEGPKGLQAVEVVKA